MCVHGFPTSSWDWHRVWPELVARFRVVAMDMLGFGFSDKPPRHDYSIAEQADLHLALLGELGIERFGVLAHDYGDTVVQELLAREAGASVGGRSVGAESVGGGSAGGGSAGVEPRASESVGGASVGSGSAVDESVGGRSVDGAPPDGETRIRVEWVCFLNGGLFPEAIRPRPIQRALQGPLGPLVSRLISERRFRKSFSAVFGPETRPSPEQLADFWSIIRWNDGVRIAHRLSRYQAERRANRERWVGALVRAGAPIRFVVGALDPVSGAAMAARYREVVPDPDVVLLDDVGHYPQIEAPDRVLDAVLELARGRAET